MNCNCRQEIRKPCWMDELSITEWSMPSYRCTYRRERRKTTRTTTTTTIRDTATTENITATTTTRNITTKTITTNIMNTTNISRGSMRALAGCGGPMPIFDRLGMKNRISCDR